MGMTSATHFSELDFVIYKLRMRIMTGYAHILASPVHSQMLLLTTFSKLKILSDTQFLKVKPYDLPILTMANYSFS